MANFPNLNNLGSSFFPTNVTNTPGFSEMTAPLKDSALSHVSNWIQNKVFTKPRKGADSYRNKSTQAGLTMSETGDATLRAGHTLYDHAVGASITLRKDGYVVITAPAGLILSGEGMSTSKGPSEALTFNAGTVCLNPLLEAVKILMPNFAASSAAGPEVNILDHFYVSAVPNALCNIPLSMVLEQVELYRDMG